MSARTRQLIFFAVLFIFIFGLAWLLLFSTGYRIHWATWSIQATGSIRVTVEQDDVLILLLPTGDVRTNSTVNFTHLTPGDYHLYLEAAGYRTTQYLLKVVPGKTLVLQPVRLWPDTTLTKLAKPVADSVFTASNDSLINDRFEIKFSDQTLTRLSTPIAAALQLDNTPYIVYITVGELHVIDSRADTSFSDVVLARTEDAITALAYQPELDRLVIRTQNGDYAFPLLVSDNT